MIHGDSDDGIFPFENLDAREANEILNLEVCGRDVKNIQKVRGENT